MTKKQNEDGIFLFTSIVIAVFIALAPVYGLYFIGEKKVAQENVVENVGDGSVIYDNIKDKNILIA